MSNIKNKKHASTIATAAIIATFFLPNIASAGMEKGDHEISFSGNFTSSDFYDALTLFTNYGVMITDKIQVKGSITLSNTKISSGFGSTTNNTGFIGAGADYYFDFSSSKMEDIEPYTGGSLTFSIGDGPSTTFVEGHVGAKNYLSEATAVFLEARLLTDTDDFLGTNTLMLLAGISVIFGK